MHSVGARSVMSECGSDSHGTGVAGMAVVGIVLREVAEAIELEWGEEADAH